MPDALNPLKLSAKTNLPPSKIMWHILNYVPKRGQSRAMLSRIIDRFSASNDGAGLELFAPSFFSVENGEQGPRRVEKPLFFHYIFIRGEAELIKRLCATFDGFSFVMDHSGFSRHLTVDDATMEAFRIIARLHGNRLECFSPEEIDLQEGDKVQVVTGQFAGLTGTYLPRKGGRTGNIVVAVAQKLGVVIYDINADCVRVLEFAKTTRRPYDQMDAYIPRLLSLMESSRPDSPANLSSALIFTRRFGSVRIGNPKVDAKLQLMLYASYLLLGEKEKADKAYSSYSSLSHNITNVWTRALCCIILGQHEEARTLLTPVPGNSISKIQQNILDHIQ